MPEIKLILGDSKEVLKEFPDNYFDSCVTDPPYGLTSIVKRFSKTSEDGDTQTEQDAKNRKTPYSRTAKGFMGHEWDGSGIEQDPEFWAEVLRVLKPGAHLLAFSGTRTYHRMAVAIEDAGFEIRDMVSWIYGQGFPKSLDISKAIDKSLGQTRKVVGVRHDGKGSDSGSEIYVMNNGKSKMSKDIDITEPASEEAKKWEGWGTALKPACEPIVLARKPISEKNVALNVLKWGTGGINIDDSRIELNGEIVPINKLEQWSGFGEKERPDYEQEVNVKGRFPSNVILDELSSQFLDSQVGIRKSGKMTSSHNRHTDSSPNGIYGKFDINHPLQETYGDSGGVSRFFYCSKVNKKERGGVTHPTMKPLSLMEYLIKLITPSNGIVLDPFLGSGSTALSCRNLGVNCVGIEMKEDYLELAKKRLELQEAL